MPKKKSINPFYLLLLVSGAAFAITAMAFGVMTVRSLQSSRMAGYEAAATSDSTLGEPTSFDDLMDRYGTNLMIGELILLAIGTVGAIAYDQHLDRKELANKTRPTPEQEQ